MSTKGISIIDATKNGGNIGFKTSFFAGIHKQLGLMPGFQGLSQDMNKLDQETQTPGSGSPLDNVRSISETVATDLIMNYEKEDKKPSNKYCKTMRRTVRELSNRHDIAFKGMVNKLKITETNAFPTFVSVVDEIFEDGQINWGRIVAVYTFAARLAQHCKESCPDCDERISLYAGKYVANKLGRWILDNGGWVSIRVHWEISKCSSTLCTAMMTERFWAYLTIVELNVFMAFNSTC
jgi:hypothetical protein